MDECDQAQAVEELERGLLIAAARAQAEGDAPCLIEGVACCRDCGEPIPVGRLAAVPGAARCVECQRDYEGS